MNARNAALEAAILAAPDDPRPYLVYGDWLLEQGDARGELVAIQARRDEALADREQALLSAHAVAWLDPFVGEGNAVTWRAGFVDALATSRLTAEGWRALGTSPVLRLVRRLRIEGAPSEGRRIVDAIASAPYPPALRELELGIPLGPATVDLLATLEGTALRVLRLRGPVLASMFAGLAGLEELRLDPLPEHVLAEIRARLPAISVRIVPR